MIVEVTDKKGLREFIDFPHDLYKNDPNYVPELYIGQKELLWKPDKHPFYLHSDLKLFLAKRDNKVVGRVAAILNRNHISYVGKEEGFFGFFDCENNTKTALSLLTTAEKWLKSQGLKTVIGPVNLTTNNTCGVLIEGFNTPPTVMMPYNSAYYIDLLSASGYTKKTDLLAYDVYKNNTESKALEMMGRLETRLKNKGIVIRNINIKDFKNEVVKLREIYNKAWDKNLGFVPMTEEEFAFTAKELKMILDPRFCIIAEKGDDIVGFALGIPNINEIQKDVSRGRLLPTGILKLLFNRSKITSLRVLMLGVLEDHRKSGIEVCLYGKIIKNAKESRIEKAECSWMLENNYLMNHAIEQINGKLSKRYRILEKAI